MSQTEWRLGEKEMFAELTPKQKAVVDAYAENPKVGDTKLSEIASEKLEGDETVSRSYVSPILEEYNDIARQRLSQVENSREEGTETTEGDPFKGQLNEHKQWQGINERTVPDVEDEATISIELTEDEVTPLLSIQEVPNTVRERLLDALVSQAFD